MNEGKNRYKNVLPYDKTRVVIKDGQVGDYINANWIPGYKNPKRYIATQGPVPTSIVDFWRMIWQEKVNVIVKVTREVESGTLKCHRYWPDPTSEPPQKVVLLGQIEVEHIKTESKANFITREFELRKGSGKLRVVQFSYESWPDHGVPLTTREFLQFRQAVKVESDKTTKPIVLHCSAGVGRTGTYLVVDRVLDAVENAEKSKDLDVDHTITSCRQSRVFMVQTEGQYEFCFDALLDGIRSALRKLLRADAKKKEAVEKLDTVSQAFVDADLNAADAHDKAEDAQIAGDSTTKGEVEQVAATQLEIEQAEQTWHSKTGESYDIKKSLSTIESRLTSLIQRGTEVDMSKYRPEQIQALVATSKAIDDRKAAEAQQKRDQFQKTEKKIAQLKVEAVQIEQKHEEKTKAQIKAAKFLQKMAK
jgi:protein tyrosine phosphatase